MEKEFTLRASNELTKTVDYQFQNVPTLIDSIKQTKTDGTLTSEEAIEFDVSSLPDWVTLTSNALVSGNPTRYSLLLTLHENTSKEQRSVSITLTQRESGNTLSFTLIQEAKPEPVINYLSYHVDHKSADDSYDYYDVYFQSEKAVASNITLEVSIDTLGQATGYSFIIDSGETRSPYFEMKANKGILGELGLLEVISIDPTEDEVYQYKVTMP